MVCSELAGQCQATADKNDGAPMCAKRLGVRRPSGAFLPQHQTVCILPHVMAGRSAFLLVEVLEHGTGRIVKKLQFAPLVQFAQASAHHREVFARQLRQFRDDFSRTHVVKLTLLSCAGKRGFEACESETEGVGSVFISAETHE